MADPRYEARKFSRAVSLPYSDLDVNGQMLKRKVPVHFGGMSDPFSNPKASATSKDLLKILSKYDYPTVISSKNTTELTTPDVVEIMCEMKYLAIQISLCTSNDELASVIEPNAPPPSERLNAIKQLSDMGFHMIVRLQPLIPPIRQEVTEELIPAVAEVGAKHVIVEFIKLPVERKMSQFEEFLIKTDWKLYELFEDKGASLVGREWLLPVDYRWDSLQPIIRSINRHGMTYGAGDYGLNHFSDTACCCGIDILDGFSKWFSGNLANAMRQANPGYITIDELENYWFPSKSIRRYMNSNSRLLGLNSIPQYLKAKWNNPGTANAPDQYLGVSWRGDFDTEGNCVYFKSEYK